MRGTFELHKILSAASLVLLAILGYMIVSLVLAGGSRQEHTGNSGPEAAESKIDLSKNPSSAGNHRIILERNIFGPAGANTAKEGPQEGKPVAQLSKPVAKKQLELRLLGTVAGNEEAACAVVEDMRTKVQDLYTTGDVIQGARIEKIDRNRIILLNEGVHEVLNLYVASEHSVASEKGIKPRATEEPSVADAVKVISPSERQINKSAFLARIGGMEAVLKTVEVSPYVVNGQARGLRITGLEGLSMARYVGLENGDVIQIINGQNVTDKRKAFQVLRKARALSSSDIQLLRGNEKKTLSFSVE